MATSVRIEELKQKFDENPRRYFAPLANELRKLGDLTQAIDICRSHLASQPGHVSGHIVLAQALFDVADLDGARSAFESALALDPENLIALRYMGDIARERGDHDDARRWYQRVLDTDPRNTEIASILAELNAEPNDGGHAPAAEQGSPQADGPSDLAVAAASESPVASWHEDQSDNALTPADAALDASTDAEPSAGVIAASPPASSDAPADDVVRPAPVDAPAPAARPEESSSWWLSTDEAGAAGAAADDRDDDPHSDLPVESRDVHAALDTSWDFPADDASQAADSDSVTPDWYEGPVDSGDDEITAFGLDEEQAVSAGPAEDDIEALFGPTSHGGADVITEDLTTSDASPLADPSDHDDQADRAEPPDHAATPDDRTPVPFATETLAELYLEQGFREEALAIYRELLRRDPSDDTLRGRIDALEADAGPDALDPTPASHRVAGGEMAAQSVRTFFGLLARRIPHQRHRLAEPGREPHGSSETPNAAPADAFASASIEGQHGGAKDLDVPDSPSGSSGLTALFAAPPPPEEDSAAASLAGAFSTGQQSAGRPSRVSQRELSLDHLFHEEPAAAPSLDTFYDAPPRETPTTGGAESVADERAKDIQQFNTWLDGLKKK